MGFVRGLFSASPGPSSHSQPYPWFNQGCDHHRALDQAAQSSSKSRSVLPRYSFRRLKRVIYCSILKADRKGSCNQRAPHGPGQARVETGKPQRSSDFALGRNGQRVQERVAGVARPRHTGNTLLIHLGWVLYCNIVPGRF